MATMTAMRTSLARSPIWLLLIILDQCAQEYAVDPCQAGQTTETIHDIGDDLWVFGASFFNEKAANSFTISDYDNPQFIKATAYLNKVGAPADKIGAALYDNINGVALEVSATENTINAAGWYDWEFDYPIENDTLYYVVLFRTGAVSPVNYYKWYRQSGNPYANGTSWIYYVGIWTEFATYDYSLKITILEDVPDCYYTWSTCQDTSNYSKSSYSWKFCNRGAYVKGAMPLLNYPIRHLPTKIDQDKFQTERGEMRFQLQEDNALPLANPNKGTSQSDTGRFFRNLLARNPNYHHRLIELYRGYNGVAVDDFELYWRGLIEDVEFTTDGIEIRALDMLYKASDARYPNKISDDNTVQDNPLLIGAGTVTVNDVDEFFDATANEPRCIKIEDEYIIYTGKGEATLTGCSRGAYSITAAEHAQGKAIKQVMVYGESDYVTGVGADHIFMDLLCNLSGIGAEYIETRTDLEVEINDAGNVGAGDTTITVENIAHLPASGIVLIGTELIRYTGVSGNDLDPCKRGMYGTTATTHDDDDPVYPTTFTHEIGRWRQGHKFRTKAESPKQVKEFVKLLQRDVLCDIWQNEAGKIECKMQAPPIYESGILDITEADMIGGDRKVKRNEQSRITRVGVYYNQLEPDPGTDPDKFTGLLWYVDADAESAENYNEIREKIFYSIFIYQDSEAKWLDAHYFMRYRVGCPIVSLGLELYHDNQEVGNLAWLSVPEIVDQNAVKDRRMYRFIKKVQSGLNKLLFEAEDTGFGDRQYRMIGPTTLVTDYDDSTEAERAKYCFIAAADDTLGAADDDPHRIY